MLWQTDASKFEWFGKGKGYATLHAYIDDATGRVVGAWFTKNESTAGYVTALGIGLEHYGLPMEIYSDRHTIFRSPQELSEEEKEEGKQRPLSNFGQGLKELGVGQIFALSPEAKGRVERLWNTMQDRLPGELRLLGVTDIDGANNVLPRLIAKHNEKFAVLPAEQESAYVEPVEKVDVDFLFARREMRKTDCGGSISYKGRTYAPSSPESGSMARTSLEVRETLSGKICAVYKGRRIELKEVEKAERAAPNNEIKENKGKSLKALGVGVVGLGAVARLGHVHDGLASRLHEVLLGGEVVLDAPHRDPGRAGHRHQARALGPPLADDFPQCADDLGPALVVVDNLRHAFYDTTIP